MRLDWLTERISNDEFESYLKNTLENPNAPMFQEWRELQTRMRSDDELWRFAKPVPKDIGPTKLALTGVALVREVDLLGFRWRRIVEMIVTMRA